MFQVASRPTAHYSNMNAYSHPTSVAPSLQLPRTLARPAFSEVARESVTAIAPELAEVPMEYIRKHLASQANE